MSGISEENRQPDSKDLEQRAKDISEMLAQHIWAIADNDKKYIEIAIYGQLLAALVSVQRETREADAVIVDERCAEILSKQTGAQDSFGMSVDTNLRMMACFLPDLANAIRSQGTDHGN